MGEILEAYYDSSRDGQNVQAVTLCGVAATQSVWGRFNPLWEAVLDKHSVPEQKLHMTYLMGLSGSFSRRNGWDEQRQQALLMDLWNVLGALRETNLRAYLCTVLLPDWQQAEADIGRMRSPESMCVNCCTGGLRLPLECAGEPKPIRLYFDRNEFFIRKVKRVTGFRQIGEIEPRDSSVYPIQAADMLAWIFNRKHHGRDNPIVDVCGICAFAIGISHRLYDYNTILADYPDGKLRQRAIKAGATA